jgi:guanine deaminase
MSDRMLRDELHQSPQQAYRDSTALIRRYHKRGRLIYAVTPRFALSTSEAMLEVCQQLMTEDADIRLQTHVNENTSEIADVRRLCPWARDYLAVYDRFRLTTSRSVMAHNVHATDSEIARMSAARTTVVHCPGSNAMLGSGIFPLRRHIAAGLTVALGTDVGGGIGFGIMKEALQANLMQRLASDPEPLDAPRLLYMATRAGAIAMGLDTEIGDFSPGKAADMVMLKPAAGSVLAAAAARASTPAELLSSIVTLAGADAVREVRVEGDVVYRAPSQ